MLQISVWITAAALPLPALAQSGNKLLTYNDTFTKPWTPESTKFQWIAENKETDGNYITDDPTTGSLYLNNALNDNKTLYMDGNKLGFTYDEVSIQPSQEHILIATNGTQQYRWSVFTDYYIYNRKTKKVAPLVPDQAGDIQYATWSPKGNTIAFVRGNNIYIWNDGVITQATTDGGVDLFNGVPDWVYEEGMYPATVSPSFH